MVVAGIWQRWGAGEEAMDSCAIVTTQSTGKMAEIHHRVPVILGPSDWPLWLGEAGKGAARLMTAAPDETLEIFRVGTEVNSNRASGPGLIAPI